MLVIIGPAIFTALLVFAGAMWLTPELRATYYMWRNNNRKARKIYERLLDQNPEKLNVYRKLGKIYYFENRQDKKALRLFEIILKLKIPFQWRDEISLLVAKYYIIEGRKDTEAIKMIEKAVDKEMARIESLA